MQVQKPGKRLVDLASGAAQLRLEPRLSAVDERGGPLVAGDNDPANSGDMALASAERRRSREILLA
jgi:hypothetical protein